MFLAATGNTVTPNQKKKFLNPVRDLGGKQNDVAKLISAGFGVTIAGVDCYLLMERIAMPVTYCKYGRRKRLQFMALVQKPTSDVLQSQLLCMCHFRSDNYTCPHTTDLSCRNVLPLQGAVTLMEKSQQRDWRHNQTLNFYNVCETCITYEPKQTDHISLTISCKPTTLSCDTMADYMIRQGEVERNFNFSSIVYGKSESGDYFVDMITLTLDPWTIHTALWPRTSSAMSFASFAATRRADVTTRIPWVYSRFERTARTRADL
ncbi:hypothetical protein G7Y89_g1580 [Cudoniella acicularis]|uniref:Uncharacterized protein n=1 Tax=Cudoniella acicularis TaxID=354080 RepID=A0A8H4RW33_9HELO|nr:hypothetical protein G7Y89_g1580 [Cudoniella acicularis]